MGAILVFRGWELNFPISFAVVWLEGVGHPQTVGFANLSHDQPDRATGWEARNAWALNSKEAERDKVMTTVP